MFLYKFFYVFLYKIGIMIFNIIEYSKIDEIFKWIKNVVMVKLSGEREIWERKGSMLWS